TLASRSRPAFPSTSVTRAVPGSEAAMRTPTACYVSTSPSAPRSRTTPKPNWMLSLPNSTAGLDKPSASRHHHTHSPKRCDDHLKPQPFGVEARDCEAVYREPGLHPTTHLRLLLSQRAAAPETTVSIRAEGDDAASMTRGKVLELDREDDGV